MKNEEEGMMEIQCEGEHQQEEINRKAEELEEKRRKATELTELKLKAIRYVVRRVFRI